MSNARDARRPANARWTLIRLIAVGRSAYRWTRYPDDYLRRMVPSWQPPCYVREYDPEVGLPSLVCTLDTRRALVLNPREAWDLLNSSPDPDRPGPLRAFDVEIVKYDPRY